MSNKNRLKIGDFVKFNRPEQYDWTSDYIGNPPWELRVVELAEPYVTVLENTLLDLDTCNRLKLSNRLIITNGQYTLSKIIENCLPETLFTID